MIIPPAAITADAPAQASTLERLAVAKRLLLDPFDLSERDLSKALAVIGQHQVDDADLYLSLIHI